MGNEVFTNTVIMISVLYPIGVIFLTHWIFKTKDNKQRLFRFLVTFLLAYLVIQDLLVAFFTLVILIGLLLLLWKSIKELKEFGK